MKSGSRLLNCSGESTLVGTLYVISAFYVISVFSFFGQPAFGQSQDLNPPYPRIATVQIGAGSKLINRERLDIIKKTDVAILGMWPGWGPFEGMTMADVVSEIRAGNPSIVVAPYTNVTETREGKLDVPEKVSGEAGPNGRGDWWLRNSSGEKTSHWPGNNSINHSNWVTPDSSGKKFPEWLADYNDRELISKANFNAVYSDVVTTRAIEVADWNGDGADDSKGSEVAVRAVSEGHAAYMNRWARLRPNFIRCGNVSDWYHPNPDRVVPKIYEQLIECGLIEGSIGHDWSIEGWGGWNAMMNQYRNVLDALRSPKIGILNVRAEKADYKTVRYGLTSALMDNGYFAVDPAGEPDFTWQYWYDEFDINLGYPIEAPQKSPWSNGVYKREFDNGLVIVNPRGNGDQTVTVGPGWKKFRGTQDAVHNVGGLVTDLRISDADGIILIRENARTENVSRPKPPVLQ
jgi:hypothetical protein